MCAYILIDCIIFIFITSIDDVVDFLLPGLRAFLQCSFLPIFKRGFVFLTLTAGPGCTTIPFLLLHDDC